MQNTQSSDTNSSKLYQIWVENNSFLKKFVSKYMTREQDVEDIVQETYIKAMLAERRKMVEMSHPKALLFTIAKNLALDELKKKCNQINRSLEVCSPTELEENVSPELEHEGMEFLEKYCEAISTLPEKTRKIYLLRKVHGMKQKDIAAKLSISLSSVEKHLKTGLLSCNDYMSGKYDDYGQ